MQRRREGKPELPPPATETAKNARIRTERRDAWWLVEREAEYWHARFKWLHALETAQRYKIGDSGSFPPPAHASPFEAVDTWREAVAKRLLTPAPTLADVASRDLSDEEIKPALKLKHEEVARFTEKHGVNLEWLLEGKGRIFQNDPIRLNPNMTGSELASVVATMPMPDQQAIRATVREILQERDQ